MIDINRDDLYKYKESKTVTRQRLTEISELGMEEVSIAEFGVKDIMSGLYIEMVWSFSDDKWKDYMDWVKDLINRNKNKKNEKK